MDRNALQPPPVSKDIQPRGSALKALVRLLARQAVKETLSESINSAGKDQQREQEQP